MAQKEKIKNIQMILMTYLEADILLCEQLK